MDRSGSCVCLCGRLHLVRQRQAPQVDRVNPNPPAPQPASVTAMDKSSITGLLFARAVLASAVAAASVSLAVSSLTVLGLARWTLADLALYFVALYFWCFVVSTAFGLPAYFLARWRGLDHLAVAALYGGVVGLGFGNWIGGREPYVLALYGALGVMGGAVFLLMLKYAPFFRSAKSTAESP